MGRDKALITLDGRTLIERALDRLQAHVSELMVIGDPGRYGHIVPSVFADVVTGKGPLGGIVTAMRFSSNDKLLVLACDMPGINDALLDLLKLNLGNFTDAVVPEHGKRIEPLCAAYHRRCASLFNAALQGDRLKMSSVLEEVRVHRLPIGPGAGWPEDLFRNVNAPDDL